MGEVNWSVNWKTCMKRTTVFIQCPKCITGFAWEYYGTGNDREVIFPNHCPYCGWERRVELYGDERSEKE